ncbi:MAG: Mur ligase family protein [Erysipelotrichales bacterium]|nr:Mur ligase family protein [Erysipelotrichales bacterium]
MIYYFIGIKGAGMSALALILNDLGESVLGSDVEEYYITEEPLLERNIEILNFNINNLREDYTYIIGNAFLKHFETIYIKEMKFRHFLYQDFINEYFNDSYRKIAVSGTHGKTTTTKIISDMFKASNQKINTLIGDGTGFGSKDNKTILFEACEYRKHFLSYSPDILVITNIELDHVDYFKDEEEVVSTFQSLAEKSRLVIYNGDCPNCQKLDVHEKITFGKSSQSNCQYHILDDTEGYHVRIDFLGKTTFFKLPFYGIYMIENFLAAYIVARINGIETKFINEMLNDFQMPKRRMSEYNLPGNKLLIDDYAHHPKEIEVTLKAIKRKYPEHQLYTIFQPHTYSRFKHFYQEILKALAVSDIFYITEPFSSARNDSKNNKLIPKSLKFDSKYIPEILGKEDSIIVFMGAGDINNLLYESMKKFS